MHAVTTHFEPSSGYLNPGTIPFDPVVCKFISIIRASREVEEQCGNNKLLTWLNNIDAADENKYNEGLQAYIKPNSTPQQALAVASIYAKIMAQYVPIESGRIKWCFNYFELVSSVKKVFEEHISENESLFSSGISIPVGNKTIYGKVEKERVYLFFKTGVSLGSGSYGAVSEIYDIASRQFLALKESFQDEKELAALDMEISNLNLLHQQVALLGSLSVEGLQSLPLATFDLPSELKGYIGFKYDYNLREWSLGYHSNTERVSMCKSLMRAFKHKTALGFWHGDLKRENFLTNGKSCVLIDWAGSVLYQQALERGSGPKYYTSDHVDLNSKICLRALFTILKEKGKEDAALNQRFLEVAHENELFSMAMVLFQTLVPYRPFDLIEDNGRDFCNVDTGLKLDSKRELMNREYSDEVIQLITKMLSSDYKNRYSDQEAVDKWEKIEVVI